MIARRRGAKPPTNDDDDDLDERRPVTRLRSASVSGYERWAQRCDDRTTPRKRTPARPPATANSDNGAYTLPHEIMPSTPAIGPSQSQSQSPSTTPGGCPASQQYDRCCCYARLARRARDPQHQADTILELQRHRRRHAVKRQDGEDGRPDDTIDPTPETPTEAIEQDPGDDGTVTVTVSVGLSLQFATITSAGSTFVSVSTAIFTISPSEDTSNSLPFRAFDNPAVGDDVVFSACIHDRYDDDFLAVDNFNHSNRDFREHAYLPPVRIIYIGASDVFDGAVRDFCVVNRPNVKLQHDGRSSQLDIHPIDKPDGQSVYRENHAEKQHLTFLTCLIHI
ncbi:hypothetical protein Dda_6051 [Drechslerella dactyloides]|uniref:Uncharacterized protein n=1 Tax=Drechslerella dactyloides TaxID=74499 RepID=A0AAD6IV46_DREDA|nr:hypothetical protein Dda_6051 [Drechslerella dactyloides]